MNCPKSGLVEDPALKLARSLACYSLRTIARPKVLAIGACLWNEDFGARPVCNRAQGN
ncbi:hypothetical protein [Leptolyngbya sp. BC1307]|uniref:hypothetical protein n=1 Tax=Leptolyngbya sp. BC1307 TaxID=2029589 RepID=UPI001483375F|nr:hypothetical protein [Leptolyngbya sp. BC1307]